MTDNADVPSISKRKSIRLVDFDYTQPNSYFVTICTHNRACLFGRIVNDVMYPNEFGNIACYIWEKIPSHFPNTVLDEWVVMPNHVHGIVSIVDSDSSSQATHAPPLRQDIDLTANSTTTPISPVGARHASPEPGRERSGKFAGTRSRSISAVVGSYKSAVSRKIGEIHRISDGTIWQRTYHDHVIRNQAALDRIRRYIKENPARWAKDPENPDRSL